MLDTPLTSQWRFQGRIQDATDARPWALDVAGAEMQGPRSSMEDAICIGYTGGLAFLGLFDGHGNDRVARWLGCVLGPRLLQLADPFDRDQITACVVAMDADVCRECISGSTALWAIVDMTTGRALVANLGDCRALLHTHGRTEAVTRDHKPEDPTERERIEAIGGQVVECHYVRDEMPMRIHRIDGDLSVSRGFGDAHHKREIGVAPSQQRVSNEPEYFDVQLRDGDALVLACDGVFDVMSNTCVGELLFGERAAVMTLETRAGNVLFEALDRNTHDNTSLVVARFVAADTSETPCQNVDIRYTYEPPLITHYESRWLRAAAYFQARHRGS